MNTKRHKKRTKYHFSDEEIYNTNKTAAEFLYYLLIEFKKVNQDNYPLSFNNKELWNQKLDQMIWSFDQLRKDYHNSPHSASFEDNEKYKEAAEKYRTDINEGFKAFGKYICNLWDLK